jgi:hypothetical protein
MKEGAPMENRALNDVVERLLADGRFLRRFRVDPDGTLRRYGLSPQAIEAIKRGDAAGLLALALSPPLVSPESAPPPGEPRERLVEPSSALATGSRHVRAHARLARSDSCAT